MGPARLPSERLRRSADPGADANADANPGVLALASLCRVRLRSIGEQVLHTVGGLAQALGYRAGVDVQRHLDPAVPEQVLHVSRVAAPSEQARRVGVSQVV